MSPVPKPTVEADPATSENIDDEDYFKVGVFLLLN